VERKLLENVLIWLERKYSASIVVTRDVAMRPEMRQTEKMET